jgi:hypothetical protein
VIDRLSTQLKKLGYCPSAIAPIHTSTRGESTCRLPARLSVLCRGILGKYP